MSYWHMKQELDSCELFPSEDDQILCKASVLSRYERRGVRGYYQDRRAQAQVATQTAAITSNTLLIVGLLIGGAILLSRK